jgi:transposase-like protein
MRKQDRSGAAGSKGGRRPTVEAAAAPVADRGRWSSRRKAEIVLRLLRGEDMDTVSRELRVTAARLAQWRDEFLSGGQGALKSRDADIRDEEIRRLRSKVGEITMDNELLYEKIRQLEANLPPAQRRSRR